MKTKFKKFSLCRMLILLLCLIAILAVPRASADVGTISVLSGTITNNATRSDFATASVDNHEIAGLEVRFSGSQAGTGNVIVSAKRNGSGTNYESTVHSTMKFTNALAGTATVIGYHQLTSAQIGSVNNLKFTVQNEDASNSGTNATIKLILKTKR